MSRKQGTAVAGAELVNSPRTQEQEKAGDCAANGHNFSVYPLLSI
jgi:hypothetical protein